MFVYGHMGISHLAALHPRLPPPTPYTHTPSTLHTISSHKCVLIYSAYNKSSLSPLKFGTLRFTTPKDI